MRRRSWFGPLCRVGWLAAVLLAASGCRLLPSRQEPPIWGTQPTLEQVVQTVNRQSAQVISLHASQARIDLPGLSPTLRAQLAMQKPRRFRLRAGTALGGPELDLGSNEQEFWIWIRRAQPPQTLVARYDRWATSPWARVVPLETDWLWGALGLVNFAPGDLHQGPRFLGRDRLEVRTTRQSPAGPLTRVVVLDARTAFPLEQHVFDSQGVRLISAVLSRPKRDELTGTLLPHRVQFVLPQAQVRFALEVNRWEVNQIGPEMQQTWLRPQFPGYPAVDLLRLAPPGALARTRYGFQQR